jgi:hypothetical protein
MAHRSYARGGINSSSDIDDLLAREIATSRHRRNSLVCLVAEVEIKTHTTRKGRGI